MRPLLLSAIYLVTLPQAHALSWQDWWVTKNQQAQTLMNAGQFAKAQATFDDPAWKATAAFRAGHYKDAAAGYQTLKSNPDTWYNLGNTMAHARQLESAMKAYDKALAIDPHHQDALHNRKIVEALLKKEKENKKDQNKQQNKQDQEKQEQSKQDQEKQDQGKQDQEKQTKTPEKQPKTQREREQQQTKEQWLHLIPDDPGGLMREKFLRDYLSRQRN